MARQALFPFYIDSFAASRRIALDETFKVALRREGRIIELQCTGRVEADKTLHLSAWSGSWYSLIQRCGTFWTSVVQLTDEQFDKYVDRELLDRAQKELDEEAAQEYKIKVNNRAYQLRKELM